MGSIVWVLGAGFSRSLRGPPLPQLLSQQSWGQLEARYPEHARLLLGRKGTLSCQYLLKDVLERTTEPSDRKLRGVARQVLGVVLAGFAQSGLRLDERQDFVRSSHLADLLLAGGLHPCHLHGSPTQPFAAFLRRLSAWRERESPSAPTRRRLKRALDGVRDAGLHRIEPPVVGHHRREPPKSRARSRAMRSVEPGVDDLEQTARNLVGPAARRDRHLVRQRR